MLATSEPTPDDACAAGGILKISQKKKKKDEK
jgi:hypothetical protein